jgi:hypothetical protein
MNSRGSGEAQTHCDNGEATQTTVLFKYWYNCTNRECKTGIFMLEDWKVENKNAAALELKAEQEYSAQMDFFARD